MLPKSLNLLIAITFIFSLVAPLPEGHADSLLGLPEPGAMVALSGTYRPVIIKAITIHKDNPFMFDFIVDVGQDHVHGEALKKEGEKLIKYFLASLAIPEKDLWVNLSPYEKDRIIPGDLGQTEMGSALLAQDYILKQITASIINPNKALGKAFWDRVYARSRLLYGNVRVPVNTFNKVWIMADKAVIYERNNTVFLLDSHLKVMLDEDYLSLAKHQVNKRTYTVNSQVLKEIILPEIEKEVNRGRNFANLRQIFSSLILASWYKQNLKDALLNQIYSDKEIINGINLRDPNIKEEIYQRYIEAYKKGVFSFIKEDANGPQGELVAHKYFSGGVVGGNIPFSYADSAMAQALMPRNNDGKGYSLVDIDAGMLVNGPKVVNRGERHSWSKFDKAGVRTLPVVNFEYYHSRDAYAAMKGQLSSFDRNNGGIDLKTQNVQWSIITDGRGIELKVDWAMVQRMKHKGVISLRPVILSILPVVNNNQF